MRRTAGVCSCHGRTRSKIFFTLLCDSLAQCAAGYSSPASTPLIAHIDTKAGHGGGKPLMKVGGCGGSALQS